MNNKLYHQKEKRRMYIELVLLKSTFDFIYWFIIQNTYSKIQLLERAYSRQAFSFDFNLSKYFISWLFTLLIIYFVTKYLIEADRPHEMVMLGLMIISFFPNMTLFALSNLKWSFWGWQVVFWSWFLFIVKFVSKKGKKTGRIFESGKEKLNKKTAEILFWGIVVIFVFGCLILSYTYFGEFHIDLSFDTEDVYSSRLAARGSFGLVTNYFRNNAMYIVIPMVCIIFLNKKRYLLFGFSLLTLVIAFSIDSQKAVLMFALVSIIAAFFIKRKVCKLIIRGMLGVNLISIIIYGITGSLTLVDYLFKRIYFLPAIIGQCHFEYVNSNQHVVLMSSLLTKLNLISDYAYTELGLPFVIGQRYFGSSSISANTGSFAGAYVYGIAGLIAIPFIYAILFKMFDNACSNLKVNYYISVVLVIAFLIGGATITSVLTVYGFVLAIFLLYLMRCTNDFESIKRIKKVKIKMK